MAFEFLPGLVSPHSEADSSLILKNILTRPSESGHRPTLGWVQREAGHGFCLPMAGVSQILALHGSFRDDVLEPSESKWRQNGWAKAE